MGNKIGTKIVGLLIVSFGVLFSIFRDFLFQLDRTQLDSSGDGLKNYFSFAYHYKFGSGMQFDGLLYPYGDLASYADAQPLLVWLLQGLRYIGIDLGNHLLFVLNISMVIGLILGVFFIYKLFRHFEISAYPSIMLSGLCVSMSPQLLKMQGHFALSYVFIIPAYWYLLIRIFQGHQLFRNRILLIGLCSLSGFIHPYLLLINTVFGLAYFFINWIKTKQFKFANVVVILLPIIIFFSTMRILDRVQDRPENPYGMDVFKTEISDLLPSTGYFHTNFKELLMLRSFTEGYGYPGVLFFISLLIILYRKYLAKSSVNVAVRLPKELNYSFLAGMLVLAFSLGVHLLLTGDLILKVIPPLAQFRSLGRFVWVFYYVGFVWAAVQFCYFIVSIKSTLRRYTLVAVVSVLSFLDVWSFHTEIFNGITQYHGDDTLLQQTELLDILISNEVDISQYQAIYTLPPSTEGTEKLYINGDWNVKTRSLPLSYQTGLPLSSCILSRTSIGHALNIVQMSSSEFIQKEILNDINEKKLLVVLSKKHKVEFSILISKCSIIGETNELELYSLSVDSLKLHRKISTEEKNSAFSIDKLKAGLVHSDHSYPFLYYNGYEDHRIVKGLISMGANLINGSNILLDENLSLLENTTIKLSFWYQIQSGNSNVPNFVLQTFDENNQEITRMGFRDWDSKKLEVIDNWVRLKIEIEVNPSIKRLKLEAFGKHLILDHLLGSFDTIKLLRNIGDEHILYDHFITNKY